MSSFKVETSHAIQQVVHSEWQIFTIPAKMHNCETQRLTDQKLSSSIFTFCSSSSSSLRPASVTSPLYDVLGHTNHIFSESSWSQDIKTDITKCLILKYTNTNTQIHKYSILQSARKTQHVVYFWKEDCSRGSKWYSHMSNTQMHKYKYTNTQIHKYTNTVWSDLQIDKTSAIFLKRKWYEDLKNNVPMSLTCKYTIQIHKYTNTNCWEYAFNTFWSKKNNLSSLFGLSNDLGVCSGYIGCTWWSPRTYWWRLLVKICVF